jgi:hypothetical protein
MSTKFLKPCEISKERQGVQRAESCCLLEVDVYITLLTLCFDSPGGGKEMEM